MILQCATHENRWEFTVKDQREGFENIHFQRASKQKNSTHNHFLQVSNVHSNLMDIGLVLAIVS